MGSFQVEGGNKLSGEITPQGAKNEALQVVCATLLTDEEVVISNLPGIRDVNLLIDILGFLGVKIHRPDDNTCSFKADGVDLSKLRTNEFAEQSKRLRGSVMLIGPLLARFRQAFIPMPGGDKIGRRRLDTHFLGFRKLGAKLEYDF